MAQADPIKEAGMMNMNLLIKLAIAVFVLGLSNASLTFATEQSADEQETAGETKEGGSMGCLPGYGVKRLYDGCKF
jgi:hypothetical protein